MVRTVRYPHLHLRDWPFYIGWDKCLYPIMADRTRLNSDITTLLRSLSRRPTSSIHLMWAWFGAGKTHTLHHIEYLCKNEFNNLTPIYMEFTRATRNFLDIYKSFISKIDLEVINNAYLEVFTSPLKNDVQRELRFDFPDLSTGLKVLYMGTEQQQEIVIRWLRAECRELRTLRTVGLTRPIVTAEDALKTISWVIRLISLGSSTSGDTRVLWIIDEFQYIKGCRPPAQEEITSCLRSVFNRCAKSLSIIISFSGRPEAKKMPPWLPRELSDIIGIEPVLLLPPLTSDDAFKFVQDLLAYFRDPRSNTSDNLFPFAKETVEEIIRIIDKKAELKPRSVMQFFDTVLREAEPQLERDEIEVITSDFAKNVLKDRVFLNQEE
ncbi:hypothetical protein ES703_80296 [subsurface metagenome]